MTDRTVTVRLEADISDFVTDIGVKAVAAVKRLEAAASKVDTSLKRSISSAKTDVEELGSKADTTSDKVAKIGVGAQASGDKISTAAGKAGRELDKLATATGKADKATAAASKTSEVASKNADSHANALGRLRVAQLRLSELQNKPGAKGSSGLAGAEESVAAAERNVKRFEKTGEDSGKSFGSGFRKWLSGSGDGLFSELGKSGGSVFGSGFLGALKTPILGPAIIAVLGAAFVTAMPAIGAVAGGALVTAFGASIAGLGLLFAAKSDMVGATWSKMLSHLGEDMKLLSKPFEGTLVNIAGFFQRTVDAFNPALSKAFASMAGPVQNFVDQLLKGFEQLVPAIGPITAAFNGILGALGPGLSSMISDLAAGLTELSVSIARNPEALGDFVAGIGSLLESALQFIATLNDINAGFSTLTGGVSLVTVVMSGLAAAIDTVAAPFRLLNTAVAGTNALLGKTGGDVAGAGKSMSDAAINTVALANGTAGIGAAAQHAGPHVQTMAEKIAAAGGQAAYTKQRYDAWIESIFRLQNMALGVSGAQINLQKAIDDASKSVKDNGRHLDINTEKGRANRSALNDIASAANHQTEEMLNSGKGIRAASNAASASQSSFIALAQKMGLSKAQAQALARQLIAVPKKTQTDFKADITDLNAKIAAAKAKLRDPNLSATKRAKLEAEIKQLLAAKAQAQASINSLTGKTVSLTTNVYRNMIETTVHKDIGVRLPAPKVNAKGGYYPNGVIPSYADGKLPQQAMVAPGKGRGMVQWAEAETGGEAFIPLAPSKRERSTEILGQVADNFGLGLVKSFADGGFLPGGRLVDIAFLLKQMGIPFNPSAGVNYGSTLKTQNTANTAAASAKGAATRANSTEAARKADVAKLQRSITLQQRYVTQLKQQGASESKIKAEQRETVALQDQLYRAKQKLTAATTASNKADATYKTKADAATKATEAHKAAIEKLIEQQKAAVDMAGQIADALTSGANIGDLFQDSFSGKGLLADLQAKGTDLAKFRVQVDQLRKQGLSEDLIAQIIGKGAEQGGEVAQAILSGGLGMVQALNKAQKALDAQANLIGAGSATKKYGQAISGARADGGPTGARKAYLVGEDGPEILRMGSRGGWVEPNSSVDPRRYVAGAAGLGGGTTTVIEKHYQEQHNHFTGVSMAEADLIAQRATNRMRMMGRR